jgi:RHS repeat-associated protein
LIDDGNISKYVPVNGKLETLTYGNGLKVKYLYDSLDRIETIMYNIGRNGAFKTVYTYQYDTNGRLFSVTDHQNRERIYYVYDFAGNLLKSYTTDTYDDWVKSSETFRYDEQSRLSNVWQQVEYAYSGGIGSAPVNYTYFYDDTTGKLDRVAIGSMGFEATVEYSIDNFGRTNQKIVLGTNFYNAYSYDYKTYNTLQESALVSQLISQTYAGEDGEAIWGTVYNYSYDLNGNITHIKDASGVIQYRYQYDELGQLTREDNRPLNKTYTWTYDDAGNILNKKTYAFTTGTLGTPTSTVTYGYDDAAWGDLLTYDGYYTIRYDEVGNPKHLLEYEEDDFLVGARLVWQGRQLMGYHLGEGYSGEIDEYYSSITFTYNADGIRIGKNVNGTQYEYIVSGSQILAEKWTYGGVEYFLQYLYDESGSPIGLNYRTSQYAENVFDVFYFEKNLQGDIVAIYNDSGTKIGTYAYDAWGNFTYSTTSGITALERNIVLNYNPFRYRGYYYDDDLGMYYLQSRYYNPQWGRFVNADGYISTGTGLLGYNMFTYCNNNPVMNVDPIGESFLAILAWGIIAVTVAATVNDIYQVASGNVPVERIVDDVDGEKKESVKIKDSYKLLTPMARLYYSAYVNHINPDTRNVVKGTSLGLEFEWMVHNTAYFLSFGTFERAGDLDAEASIFSDDHGFYSIAMKMAYMSLYGPIFVISDIIANGGFNP